jgi:cellulose synthase/poly-beta-1,6-N-acetylglucosamine synthase-like glycosyltransferase
MKSTPRFRRWDYPVFFALTALHLSVVGFVIVAWISRGEVSAIHPLVLAILATVALQFALWEWRWIALPLMRVPEPTVPRAGLRVGVAVTFVPGAESVEMLETTVAALVAMRYPHDTWVLDEGNDAQVRRVCQRLGAKHYSRLGTPRYQQAEGRFKAATKYGNYNAWLEDVGYEAYDIVVAFDSDHVAKPEYLTSVLGYFEDEKVGYIQAAQVYSNQGASFIARAAAEETYAYYSSVQMTAFAVGYPMVVGCHNAHRVTALRQIGGFSPHEADDMVMTLLYRAHGWRGVYVPKILARGLTPVSWGAYLGQQRRWARSVLDFKLRVFPKHAKQLPFLERVLTYVHGIYYLRGPVIGLRLALITLMLALSWLPAGGATGVSLLAGLGAIWLTVFLCDLFRQRFFLDVRNEWGLHWRSMFIACVKWPYFVLAWWDAIRGQYGTYTLTPKARRTSTPVGFGTLHAVVAVVIAAAWLVDLVRGPSEFIAIHIAAAFAVFTSLMAVVTSTWTYPPAYQEVSPRRSRFVERAPVHEVAVPVPMYAEAAAAPVRQLPVTPAAAKEQIRALG